MKNVLYCGYRSWAHDAFEILKKDGAAKWTLCDHPKKLKKLLSRRKFDFGVLAGWSWLLDRDTLSRCRFFGIHPSDLPDYRGGSPIQNQIIDGIRRTKCTLFEIRVSVDRG